MQTASRQPLWDRDEPRARRPVAALERDAIVQAAVELADADGLEAVSVRKVAARLDAGPMRLYRFFDTVGELNELMVDEVYGQMLGRRGNGDWRARVHLVARRTRRSVLAHPWFADLWGGRPHLGPNALVWLEELASAVADAPGVDSPSQLWTALGAVSGYLTGTLRAEASELRTSRPGNTKPDWHASLAPYLTRMLATGEFPTVERLVRARDRPATAASFRGGLDLVLDGIASPGRR